MRARPGARLSAEARTPLTVIGGFLGAGKTTFLNRLLAHATGRIAVLVNDFGAVNVDAGLVADHDGQTLRLTNGCVCCSLADGFLTTLMRVLDEPFDAIVVEASGVGDPAAIAEIALVEPGLRLGAVLILADADRLPALLADERVGDTVRRQIAAADIVLLNKADLAGPDGLEAARAALAALGPVRTVAIAAPHAGPEIVETAWEFAGSRIRATAGEAADHEDAFRRLLYRRSAPFDRAGLDAALGALPARLLRLKGKVTLAGEPEPLLLQVVGARRELSALPAGGGWDDAIVLAGVLTDEGNADDVATLLDGALAPP